MQRTIPPAAAPLSGLDLLHGIDALFFPERYEQQLTGELKEYFGVRHVFPVSSGKAALTVILRALHSLAPDKREVVIPAYTCFSVPSAVVKAGLTVRLCDIDPATFDLDQSLLPGILNGKTLCVVAGHLFGIPSDVDRIARLCSSRGIFVVEDAAQSMGGSLRGKKLGTVGDAGFFSFGRGKNVTCGSGGVILTGSDRIASAAREQYARLPCPSAAAQLLELTKAFLLAVFIRPRFYWFPAGLPFLKLGETFFYTDFPVERLVGLKAGLLTHWCKQLERSNHVRTQNARFFRSALGLDGREDEAVPYLRLPVLARDRSAQARICRESREQGLGITGMYPSGINEIREIAPLFAGMNFPAAEDIAARLFTLPTHHLLSEKDREKIVRFVKTHGSSERPAEANGRHQPGRSTEARCR